MIDIIIPLGKETRWNDMELKYALRAIEKYLTGYRQIIIVGKKRSWLKEAEEVQLQGGKWYGEGIVYIDINLNENSETKQRCIFQKILKAAKDERVSDTFAMWHDDHMLLQPLDMKDIKYWKSGTLDNLGAVAQGTYQRTVLNSNKYIKEQGWTNYHYDIHTPILFEKNKFIELENEDWKKEMILKSLYCNKYGIKGEEMKDLKIGKPLKREDIRKAIAGRLFFSISENGTNDAVKDILAELYPEPSKYEVRVIEDITLTEVSILPDGSHGIGYIENKNSEL